MGAYFATERQFKLSMLDRNAHDALIMGSSRFALIDPDTLAREYSFFNAAFSAALPEEMLRYIRTRTEPWRLVVIGFDPYMFDEARHPLQENPLGNELDFWSRFKSVISLPLFFKSLHALRLKSRGVVPQILADGQQNVADSERRHREMPAPHYDPEGLAATRQMMANYRFSEPRLEILRTIKRELENRGIPHIFVLNPVNAFLHDESGRLAAAVERLAAELPQIDAGIVDFSKEYSTPEYYFKFDPGHFRPDVGTQIVMRAICARGFASPDACTDFGG